MISFQQMNFAKIEKPLAKTNQGNEAKANDKMIVEIIQIEQRNVEEGEKYEQRQKLKNSQNEIN